MKIKTKGNPNTKLKQNPIIGKSLSNLYLWFLKSYFPDRMAVYQKWSTEYINIINKLSTSRGKRFALSYNKLTRLSITRYLSGAPLPVNTPGIKLNNDGLPSRFYFFHPLIRKGEHSDLKIIFTLLNLTRGVILEPLNNFETITDSWEGNLPINWYTFQSAVKSTLGYKRQKYKFTGLHTSTKSGPNGQAMAFAFQDYLFLPDDLKKSLVDLGGPEFANILSLIEKPFNGVPVYQHWFDIHKFDTPKEGLIRKISTFGDREGKTRIIGILDYWSQCVLRPIHKGIEKILKNIPEDCTFDQTSWYSKLPPKCTYYSFDLTAATDRLPVKHQKLIVASVFSKRVADAWENILINYEFTHKPTSTKVCYSTGQPMGAYSSWPVMSLQHHSIVHYAAILVGVNPRGKYVLLGDDIVIADDQIAKSYQAVMSELKVPISLMKTHKSNDICEFAKRWYYKGSEITAFPLHSLKENLSRYYTLQNSIEDSRRKGYVLSEESEPESMINLIKLTGKKSQALRIYKLYKLFDAIVGIKNNTNSSIERIGNIRKTILANWNIPEGNLNKITEENFSSHVDFILEEYFLDLTSDGNNEMMTMMDHIKSWEKSCKATPGLWDAIKVSSPIVSAFTTCWAERTTIMNRYYKEFANDKDKLRASLILLRDLPCVSEKIVNTRNARAILAAQSRLVKTLIESLMKVPIPEAEMTDEDWMSQMTTIHSDPGQEDNS